MIGNTREPSRPGWVRGRSAAASYLGVSERTISAWVAEGVLQGQRIGRRMTLFRLRDLDEVVEKLAGDNAGSRNQHSTAQDPTEERHGETNQ